MAHITTRKVKGKQYYYLEESIKQGKKWIKESVYLGAELPNNKKLLEIYEKFVQKLKKIGATGIVPPFTEFLSRSMAIKIANATENKIRFLRELTATQRIEFIKRERITFVTDSNAIEGSTLDYWLTERVISDQKRIERLQKRGVAITNMDREEQEALNLNKCLDLYEQFLKHKKDISADMILKFHCVLLSKIDGYEQYCGLWRPVNVRVRGSDHVFPHHQEVPKLIEELVSWYAENNELVHPVELAAKFHTKFTTIHPFADGNGRMVRLLMNYILQKYHLPFTNIPLNKRSAYMKTQAAGNVENHKPFVLFLANGIVKQNKKLK
ncbi:Fic family protein [Candidatus Micrarchaeota archaeon]|nr:Fic family protein [Candidatus Micrarchaeota archaeon]MBU1166382.1 Fic family protein [Candidatus Micrarchaeota archaeon]MBU1887186.1 Fic family protein [Candidatus Micrarchaeota archaeon]